MKALIVYDSVFGNTEKIAQSVHQTLQSKMDIEICKVAQFRTDRLSGVNLLIVGSPTRAFSPMPAIKKMLRSIPRGSLKRVAVAAFDTRMTQAEIDSSVKILGVLVKIFGYAAEPIARRLQKKGGKLVLPAEPFYVEGAEGPLLDGELERATEWAKKIMQTM